MKRSNKPKKLNYVGRRAPLTVDKKGVVKPMTRNDYQKKALNDWANQGFKGSIIAATGFGKSRVATLAIAYSYNELEDQEARCLVLVPPQHLREHSPNQFAQGGF